MGLKKPMSKYTLKDIPQLCKEIAELYSNLLGPLPLELPPLCEVLHEIPLIDEAHFFLSKSKVDLFSNNVDCLGHVIDDKGIHAESDKIQRI